MDQKDEVVISGISGRYPDCDTFQEFADALLKGVDLITVDDRRFTPGTYDLPERSGKINGVEYFDASVFNISQKQADFMDPRHRVLLETVFEAILDSGYNPQEIRGSKTGVYVAIGHMDNMQAFKEDDNTQGYLILGSTLSQAANRVSFGFDFKGPSYILDTACSGGMYAMVNAIKDIQSGETDSAIVAGVQINFHPFDSREFLLLNMLAKDGKCKVYSTERDGYARSEAIVSVFLQKKSNARRIYASVLGAKTNSDGHKKEGITYPSVQVQTDLMKNLYSQSNVDPTQIAYVEMHGTGTPAGDMVECQSIANNFCGSGRKGPLLVGAVKSNMGHSEVSSGLCSVSKVLVAMESGIIPANLHCEKIDYTLPGIQDNKLKVVTENTPWPGGMVGLNCFGFGGSNAHVILKSNEKLKKQLPPPTKLPHRLVNVSGRSEECVQHLLDGVKKNRDDEEFLALIDEIHKLPVEGHFYRGYTVLGDNPKTEIAQISREKRPIWFIYAGMGSQWTGMGKDLMKIDVFRNTFKRCANALKPFDVDLEKIVLSDDPAVFDNIANCFAAISSTEIALTDVLKSVGIEPDGMAGHSLGEVGCAYANGDLTVEEAALIGYARGYATVRSQSVAGKMAAVGLSKEECEKLLPEGVYIACVNASRSVTITGPEKLVDIFVEKLNENGVFAKGVKTAGYAFHSKYVETATPILFNFVKNIIKTPKLRSKKWISSSWPDTEWDHEHTKYNSAEYHSHNFQSPVLFDQVYKYIPKNAIVIEVAPHGLLLSILKKELGPDTTSLCLVNRTESDNCQFLLSSIGKIYINGGEPNLKVLSPSVSYPVSKGTPSVGSLIKWQHSIKWFTPFFKNKDYFGKIVKVNLADAKYSHFSGHNIDGRVLMPATGYLELVWQVQAHLLLKKMPELPVVFENVQFLRATVIPADQDVSFLVNIMKQSGNFEIFEGGSVVCSGRVTIPKNISKEFTPCETPTITKNGYLPLKTNDIYKLFNLNRYLYDDKFKGISEINSDGTVGNLKWFDSFTSFFDAMLQVTLVTDHFNDLMLPTKIQKIVIDPVAHLDKIDNETNEIPVYFDKDLKIINSGGVQIVNMEASKAPKRQQTQPDAILEKNVFVPYISDSQSEIDVEQNLKIILQIVLENNEGVKQVRTGEVSGVSEEVKLGEKLQNVALEEPLASVELVELRPKSDSKTPKFDLIIVPQQTKDDFSSDVLVESLRKDGFLLLQGDKNAVEKFGLTVVYQNLYQGKGLFLLRKTEKPSTYGVVKVSNAKFSWMEELKQLIKEKDVTYLLSQNEETSGIVGLVKCLNLEPKEKSSIKCVFIRDQNADKFSVDSEFYRRQLDKNLTFNILCRNVWGSYRHVKLRPMQNIPVEHASNVIQTLGDFSTLTWAERPSTYFKCFEQSELAYVFYSALNFRDVMTSAGKVAPVKLHDVTAPEPSCGLEFSGLTQSGKRVMGILSGLGIGLQVVNDPLFTWPVPKSWSLEDAATVPLVYATCYYALIIRGQLQPGESILIHSGTGGVGIAAIALALSMNCTVYTTVSTQEKREYVKKMFPKVKEENIGNSRDASFEQMIKKSTKGQGVDLVLNSLSADLFQASIRCLGRRGRFLEIGKVDLEAGTPISAGMFAKNSSFHGVLLDDLFESSDAVKGHLHELVSEGISKGIIRPLPRTVFQETEVEDAYRYLSAGKHKGKVLIKIRSEDPETLKNPTRTILACPRMYFDPEKSFILVGGLGGFGLALVDFLIKRNAKNFVLNGRNGVTNGYQSFCLKRWAGLDGVTVRVNADDTSTLEGAENLVKAAEKLGPVGGIFNMALVLQDALFPNQTPEKFNSVFKAKITSGCNMDVITRKLCPDLDHFVVFSSIACGRGNAGQSNYGMANSALERLCEKRREEGLPGLAVQWGIVGDVGAVAEANKFDKHLSVSGLLPQRITSCLDALETFMLHPCAIGASHVLAEQHSSSAATSGKTPTETVAHILGIRNIDSINKTQTLSELGLDSLMTAEIKQTLYRNFNLEINAEEIRDWTFDTIEKLTDSNTDVSDKKTGPSNNVSSQTNGVNTNFESPVLPILQKEIVAEIKKERSADKSVFLIHPIEGHVEFMIPLAKQLKANVYGLQCTRDIKFDQIRDYASYFVQIIKNIQKKGPYHVIGYSYGAALAFEIGVQLEKLGEIVEIYCIDGSPAFLKLILEELYENNDKSEQKAKINILKKFTRYFEEVDHEKTDKLLDASVTWKEQLKILGESISKETNHNSEDIEISADRFFSRVHAGYFYEPKDVFRGKMVLVRSSDMYLKIDKDYELQKVCEKTVTLYELKGNHLQMLLGDNVNKISEIINKSLALKN